MITIKRVYDPASRADGHHVLVDRLWPRGLTKGDARLDEWLREIAPSNELRKWFGHAPERWPEFVTRFRQELAEPTRAAHIERLRTLAADRTATLLYAARDDRHNNAVVIADLLRNK